MNAAQAAARHAALAGEIRRHDHAYYVLAKPTVSDFDYDRLYSELVELERQFPALVTPESPTQRVGGSATEGFRRIRHLAPMLSLEKIEASDQPTTAEEPDLVRRSRLQDERTVRKLREFDAGLRKLLGRDRIEYIMEPKVDGVSIGVQYRDGKLVLGATRGDGAEGDDITVNLRTVRAIPLTLAGGGRVPALFEARGEAYMSSRDFEQLNARLVAAGEESFPNARNATAGALKQLDPKLVAARPISAVFYAAGACEGIAFESHSELLEQLKAFGFPTQPVGWVCQDIEEVLRVYEREIVCGYDEANDLRQRLPYEIDGIVLKVNSLADARRIPPKRRAPGDAIVHKPVPWITPAETVLRSITIQVGRTGVLTPVAELEPVEVQGSTISRATLHNEDEIRRKDIRIGDTVVIRKAGMVIPEVLEVIQARRPAEAKAFDLVAHVGGKCPACGGPIAREKISSGAAEEVAWRCQNVAGCPAQMTRRVEYFAQRKALDVESLGGIVAEKLVESGLVREPLDLFDLTLEPLAKLNLGTAEEPRVFGEKNAAKVLEALQRARRLPLHRWIQALAIPEIGEATAWQLAQTHESFGELADSGILRDIRDLSATEAERALLSPRSRKNPPKDADDKARRELRDTELASEIAALKQRLKKSRAKTRLAEVGPVAAGSVLAYFESGNGRRTLRRLRQLDIDPRGGGGKAPAEADEADGSGPLAGKTFVLTGTLPTLSRDEASAMIREAGGSVSGSVSKQTDYVLVGGSAGSKLEKARSLGITLLDETEFRALLGSHSRPGDAEPRRLL